MRGKEGKPYRSATPSGITPAYAGKRWNKMVSVLENGDHPRVCGEKFMQETQPTEDGGSPPRMRGKANVMMKGEIGMRITPAYAGKRKFSYSIAHAVEDHPRVCGEKQTFQPAEVCCEGSPPRMRGKALKKGLIPSLYRITPAYAGKRCRHFTI